MNEPQYPNPPPQAALYPPRTSPLRGAHPNTAGFRETIALRLLPQTLAPHEHRRPRINPTPAQATCSAQPAPAFPTARRRSGNPARPARRLHRKTRLLGRSRTASPIMKCDEHVE